MKRRLKYFLVTLLSLVMALSCCFVLASCSKENSSGNSSGGVTSGETVVAPPDDGLPKTDYLITVLLPDNTPAYGVVVQLIETQENELYSSASTGSDGLAKVTAAKDLEYKIQIDRLPAGYAFTQNVTVNGEDSVKTVCLNVVSEGNERYEITVKSVGGLNLKEVLVSLGENGSAISSAYTDKNGVASIPVEELKEYDVTVELPNGYTLTESSVKTSSSENTLTLTASSKVISEEVPSNYYYTVGDIMYDFSVVTSDGKTFTLSEALKTHKLVFINFWYSWCGPCVGEFDDMERAYQDFKDDVAIIALSVYDNSGDVAAFKAQHKLTFNMGADTISLNSNFSRYITGYPTSVLVDRYGRIADCGSGALTEDKFRKEFEEYTSDDYVQKDVDDNGDDPDKPIIIEPDKPDVTMPDTALIEAAINKGGLVGEYTDANNANIWPWLISEDGDSIYAANAGHHRTTATINLTVNLQPGQFLTFDYKLNTEDVGNADMLYVYLDGSEMAVLYGVTDGWETCYVYTPLESGTYTLTLSYVKDNDDVWLVGDESVQVKNMRTVTEADIKAANVSLNMFREASTGINTAEDRTSNWTNYVTVVMGDDGYYRVGTKDGPYLLANLMGATHYAGNSVTQLAYGGYFELIGMGDLKDYFANGIENPDSYSEGIKSYSWLANNSDIPGYCPVDWVLYELLDRLVYNLHETTYQGAPLAAYYTSNTWLELCGYYDHYGVGEPMDNPLRGICQAEAFEATAGKNHVNVNKVLVPRGMVYSFTCSYTGVYRIYSVIPESEESLSDTGAAVWIVGNGVNIGQDAMRNYNVYVNFEEGKTYYISTAFSTPDVTGEFDFYIELIGASYDEFTYASDGTYTYSDETFTKEIIVRNHGMRARLGTDGFYHQILSDGTLDSGDKSYIWVDMTATTNRFNSASLEQLAKGTALVDGIKFFDFTAEEGVDYSSVILEYVAKADTEGDTKGMVKADERLVEILNKALARIDHKAEDSWFGLAYYYYHVGDYTPAA